MRLIAATNKPLEEAVVPGGLLGTSMSIPKEGKAVLEAAKGLGLAGVIAKKLDSAYVNGPNADWLEISGCLKSMVQSTFSRRAGARCSLAFSFAWFFAFSRRLELGLLVFFLIEFLYVGNGLRRRSFTKLFLARDRVRFELRNFRGSHVAW